MPSRPEACTGTPTDNGNGTTTIACNDGTKDLVCTNVDCSGVTSVIIEGTDLARVLLTSLEQVEGGWRLRGPEGGLQVVGNPLLTTLSLPALRAGELILVADNPVLTTVELPALAVADSLSFSQPNFSSGSRSSRALEAFGARAAATGGNRALAALSLPALRSMRWMYVGAENAALGDLDLPSLTTGQLMVAAPALTSLRLPAMVDGTVSLSGATVATVEFPALASGSVNLTGLPMTSLSLPVLSAGSLEIRDAPALESVSLPALTAGGLIQFERCPSLTSVSAPALVSGEVRFTGTGALVSALLPRLVTGSLTISDNPSISACQALGWLADLRAAGFTGKAWISGNGSSASCPALGMCQSLTISNGQDWEALIAGDCGEIAGDLTILTSVTSLPPNAKVHTIDGALVVQDNPSLTSLSMPALTAGGVSIVSCPAFSMLSLPELSTGTVMLERDYALAELSLPAFTRGDVSILSCPVLSALSLPELRAGTVMLDNDYALTELSLPALSSGVAIANYTPLGSLGLPVLTSGDVFLGTMATVADLSLPMLTTGFVHVSVNDDVRSISLPALISGRVRAEWASSLTAVSLPVLTTGAVEIANTSLSSLSLPAFTSGDLSIEHNWALTSLSLPVLVSSGTVTLHENALPQVDLHALRSVGSSLTITDNSGYPQCAAEAILAQLVAFTGTATISGNDTTATCSP